MFRNKLARKPQDGRRAELLALVKASQNVPRQMKAMALLAVSSMKSDELDKALAVARAIQPAVEAQDAEGVLRVLREQGVPEDVIKVSEGLLVGRSNDHHSKQG